MSTQTLDILLDIDRDDDADTRPKVTTWADGFGIWHARVIGSPKLSTCVARRLARRAISEELTARAPRNAHAPRFGLASVTTLHSDTHATYVYSEKV